MRKKLLKRKREIRMALLRRLAMRQKFGMGHKTNEAMIAVHSKALHVVNRELMKDYYGQAGVGECHT